MCSAYGLVKKGDYVLLSRGNKVGVVEHVDMVSHYTPDISVRVPEGAKGEGADTCKGVRINEVEVLDRATGESFVKQVRGEVGNRNAGGARPGAQFQSSMFGGGS